MDRKVDVAIVGAGTSGLSALREVRKQTDSFVVIGGGPHGTTCARVGCMPSKVLIQVANDFHRRHKLKEQGIHGAEDLTVDVGQALAHVRSLRDYFVSGVLKAVDKLEDKRIDGFAKFIEPGVLEVNGQKVIAKAVVIATGSKPFVPSKWETFRDQVWTTDEFFEQSHLPKRMAVVGTGVIGLELGQAIARLGIETHAFGSREFVGGLTDPEVNKYAVRLLSADMNLALGSRATAEKRGEELVCSNGSIQTSVDNVLASLGRRPNLAELDLGKAGVELNEKGIPTFDPTTMQVGDLPIFIAGDVNADRPILHEAADEGRIAGYNALRDKPHCFKRRTPMGITFCSPNIAFAGHRFSDLTASKTPFVVGEVLFDDQGRSRVMRSNAGMMRIYGDPSNGKVLGAEMIAPRGEHMAHQLAWIIQQGLTVVQALQLPFYHPVVEEGMRTALRDLLNKTDIDGPRFEIAMCESNPPEVLE